MALTPTPDQNRRLADAQQRGKSLWAHSQASGILEEAANQLRETDPARARLLQDQADRLLGEKPAGIIPPAKPGAASAETNRVLHDAAQKMQRLAQQQKTQGNATDGDAFTNLANHIPTIGQTPPAAPVVRATRTRLVTELKAKPVPLPVEKHHKPVRVKTHRHVLGNNAPASNPALAAHLDIPPVAIDIKMPPIEMAAITPDLGNPDLVASSRLDLASDPRPKTHNPIFDAGVHRWKKERGTNGLTHAQELAVVAADDKRLRQAGKPAESFAKADPARKRGKPVVPQGPLV